MSTTIQILHASHGDCIFISHEKGKQKFNLLIDGGPTGTFGQLSGYAMPLRLLLEELIERKEVIDLAVITHVDDDHIGGILEAISFKEYLPELVKEYWFNSYDRITSSDNDSADVNNSVSGVAGTEVNTSIAQGVSLEATLENLNWFDEVIHNEIDPLFRSGVKITVLSPTRRSLKRLAKDWKREYPDREKDTARKQTDHHYPFSAFVSDQSFQSDRSVPNGSSIALLLEVDDTKILLLADSYAHTVEQKLRDMGFSEDNPLVCDLVKISHHGSKGNTTKTLLSIIRSGKYVISTDGSVYGHPDKRTVARILNAHSGNQVYFNYESVMRSILHHEDEAFAGRLHVCEDKMVI